MPLTIVNVSVSFSLRFDYPTAAFEQTIVMRESGADKALAARLVELGTALRALKDHDLEESAPGCWFISLARLIHSGFAPSEACRAGLIEPLSDNNETVEALMEVAMVTFE